MLPNGDVAICPVLSAEKDLILGNVNTVIKWDKIDGLLNFSSDKIEPCSKCWIRKFCGGGCFASNYKVNGNLLKLYKQLCNVSKHVVLQSIVLFSKICENHYKEFFLEL
ncbi:MAG: SPASM domain-containing protein [Spirochaetaceae bacterium]|nr:SPASM domain-containing protein [Spirochaetaceae bacterium]